MRSENMCGSILFAWLIGGVLTYMGVRVKRGEQKWDFLRQRTPYFTKDVQYMYLPSGLGILLVGISLFIGGVFFPNTDNLIRRFLGAMIILGLLGGTLVGFLCILIRPKFLKPEWLLWLEAHYDKTTIDFMFAYARDNPKEWLHRTYSQKGLEDWAEEMELRHRLTCLTKGSPRYQEALEKLAEISSPPQEDPSLRSG